MSDSINLQVPNRPELDRFVNEHNVRQKELGRESKKTLDIDDFIKILVTQITHQDPTKPMEDREFIAQMAQFSSLDQMMNMSTTMGSLNQEFSKLANTFSAGQAFSLLGQEVTIIDGGNIVTGIIDEVSGREFPQVLVGGTYYDFSKVQKVMNKEADL